MIDEKEIEQAHFGHIDQYQIVVISALKGKQLNPLKNIEIDYNSGLMLQHFDDNTFAVWGIRHGDHYEGGHIVLKDERPDPWDLYGLGIISKEDYESYQSDIKSRNKNIDKMRRRKRYEILKAEFEGDD